MLLGERVAVMSKKGNGKKGDVNALLQLEEKLEQTQASEAKLMVPVPYPMSPDSATSQRTCFSSITICLVHENNIIFTLFDI